MHQLCTRNGIVTFSIHNRGEFPLIGRVKLYGGRRLKIPAELSSAGYSRVAAWAEERVVANPAILQEWMEEGIHAGQPPPLCCVGETEVKFTKIQ